MIGRAGQATPVTVSIADRTNATAMQFSPSGRWLAVNFQDRSVRLFDSNTGAIRRVLRGHDEPIVRFSFSADERLLLGIGEVRSRIWGLPGGERIAVLPLAIRGTTIKSAVFSPNARSLAFVAHDRVLVWQCEACGGREAMLAEVERRRVDRPLSAEEIQRFGLDRAAARQRTTTPTRTCSPACRPSPSPRRRPARSCAELGSLFSCLLSPELLRDRRREFHARGFVGVAGLREAHPLPGV